MLEVMPRQTRYPAKASPNIISHAQWMYKETEEKDLDKKYKSLEKLGPRSDGNIGSMCSSRECGNVASNHTLTHLRSNHGSFLAWWLTVAFNIIETERAKKQEATSAPLRMNHIKNESFCLHVVLFV